jgi:endonuclease-3 related protein
MNVTPQKLYKLILKKFGNLNWWPIDKNYHIKNKSDPRFEIIVGAILTQNTAWPNVEKALSNIKSENLLDIKKISDLDIRVLKRLIRPSGFFNQKAQRLKIFTQYLEKNYDGDLNKFFNRNLLEIRKELLAINGIGPETADSILLYAGNKPIFVVDAYTKRICQRIPFDVEISYDEIQSYFQNELLKTYGKDEIIKIYNELHALIVNFAKINCKKNPDCTHCFLKEVCAYQKKLSK